MNEPMMNEAVHRIIPQRSQGSFRRLAGSWETLLVFIAVAIFFAMGFALQLGADTPMLVLVGLGTGLLCGAFNGLLVAGLGLPSIVVTIGTLSLFRGIAYIVLGDQAYSGYPDSFAFFGQGYVWWVITFEMVLFAVAALVFGLLLHRTGFGRAVYANLASRFYSSLNCVWLGAGDCHHGGIGWRQYSRRGRDDSGRCAGGDYHGHGDLWVWSVERARYRHVYLHRTVADLSHCLAEACYRCCGTA